MSLYETRRTVTNTVTNEVAEKVKKFDNLVYSWTEDPENNPSRVKYRTVVLVREFYTLGLKEAVDIVEHVIEGKELPNV